MNCFAGSKCKCSIMHASATAAAYHVNFRNAVKAGNHDVHVQAQRLP